MLKKTLLLLLAFSLQSLFAQECGTPPALSNQVFNIDENFDAQYCLNIKFHIVRQTNGTGGIDAAQIPTIINNINQYFNVHSINVSSIGFTYIDNSNLYSFQNSEFAQLVGLNNAPNALNIYIVNTAEYYGRAESILSRNLVVRADRALSSTMPHEIGHCFNLLHTFQGTKSGTGGCPENINSSNCASCGDNVCDTPADAGTGYGAGYNPDLTNLMSYYITRDHFTIQQGSRMRNAIAGSSMLQALLSSQCIGIIGSNPICNGLEYQYNITNTQGATVTWSSSPNLTLTNKTNLGVTVSVNSSSLNNTGTITAIVNGMTISKTLNTYLVTSLPTPSGYFETRDVECNDDRALKLNFIPNVPFGGVITLSPSTIPHPLQSQNKKITVRYTNPCTGQTTSKIITFYHQAPICNNSKNTDKFNYSVFPNPTNDALNIELPKYNIDDAFEKRAVLGEIFDMLGQLKFTFELSSDKTSISIRNFPKGIYILKIYAHDQVETHQIVKN